MNTHNPEVSGRLVSIWATESRNRDFASPLLVIKNKASTCPRFFLGGKHDLILGIIHRISCDEVYRKSCPSAPSYPSKLTVPMCLQGKYGKTMVPSRLTNITMEKSPCLTGKLTISMTMFNSYVSHYPGILSLWSLFLSTLMDKWLVSPPRTRHSSSPACGRTRSPCTAPAPSLPPVETYRFLRNPEVGFGD